MGSYRQAIMTGFVCRLCSEHKNIVIHVYSKRAKSMALLDKIKMLPITIKKFDKLPKTICESCIDNLCRQYDLVQKIQKSMEVQIKHRRYHGNGRCSIECPFFGTTPVPPPNVGLISSEASGPSQDGGEEHSNNSSSDADAIESSDSNSSNQNLIVLSDNNSEQDLPNT